MRLLPFLRNVNRPLDDPVTCSTRTVTAPDGAAIPVPVGGLGLPDGTFVVISPDAQVNINLTGNGGYSVVLNNSPGADGEADALFAEFITDASIARLELLVSQLIASLPKLAIRGAGLLAGVLVSVFTSSNLTREVPMRCDLDQGNMTDGPPVTYMMLLPA
jgi:hypothetical protein